MKSSVTTASASASVFVVVVVVAIVVVASEGKLLISQSYMIRLIEITLGSSDKEVVGSKTLGLGHIRARTENSHFCKSPAKFSQNNRKTAVTGAIIERSRRNLH